MKKWTDYFILLELHASLGISFVFLAAMADGSTVFETRIGYPTRQVTGYYISSKKPRPKIPQALKSKLYPKLVENRLYVLGA